MLNSKSLSAVGDRGRKGEVGTNKTKPDPPHGSKNQIDHQHKSRNMKEPPEIADGNGSGAIGQEVGGKKK